MVQFNTFCIRCGQTTKHTNKIELKAYGKVFMSGSVCAYCRDVIMKRQKER